MKLGGGGTTGSLLATRGGGWCMRILLLLGGNPFGKRETKPCASIYPGRSGGVFDERLFFGGTGGLVRTSMETACLSLAWSNPKKFEGLEKGKPLGNPSTRAPLFGDAVQPTSRHDVLAGAGRFAMNNKLDLTCKLFTGDPHARNASSRVVDKTS